MEGLIVIVVGGNVVVVSDGDGGRVVVGAELLVIDVDDVVEDIMEDELGAGHATLCRGRNLQRR